MRVIRTGTGIHPWKVKSVYTESRYRFFYEIEICIDLKERSHIAPVTDVHDD